MPKLTTQSPPRTHSSGPGAGARGDNERSLSQRVDELVPPHRRTKRETALRRRWGYETQLTIGQPRSDLWLADSLVEGIGQYASDCTAPVQRAMHCRCIDATCSARNHRQSAARGSLGNLGRKDKRLFIGIP